MEQLHAEAESLCAIPRQDSEIDFSIKLSQVTDGPNLLVSIRQSKCVSWINPKTLFVINKEIRLWIISFVSR